MSYTDYLLIAGIILLIPKLFGGTLGKITDFIKSMFSGVSAITLKPTVTAIDTVQLVSDWQTLRQNAKRANLEGAMSKLDDIFPLLNSEKVK